MQNRKPDYLAMTIDSGDESVYRKEIFPEYKANRTPPPDDFFPQEKRILQIVRDAGIPVLSSQGLRRMIIRHYADCTRFERMRTALMDAIYCLQGQRPAPASGLAASSCTIVQCDSVMDAARRGPSWAISAEQAIDIQTLMGDAIDNVQGIPGVGEKTAAKLITSYGNIEGIYKNLEKLTPKLRENLQTYSARLPISRKQLIDVK